MRMQLEVQIAADGDDVDDPSSIWPDERERVVVGTLEITGDRPRRRRLDRHGPDARSSTGSSPPAIRCCTTARRSTTSRTGAEPPSSLFRMRVGLVLGAGGVQGGAWLTGGLDALATADRLGPGHRRRRRRHLGRLGDRLALRRRDPALVHGRPLGRRDLRRRRRRARAARRPRPTAPAAPASGSSAPGRRSAPAPGRWRCAPCARPHRYPPAAAFAGWAAARLHLHRAAEGHRSAASSRAAGPTTPTTGSSPATTPPARRVAFGRDGRPAGRARRRGRRLLRDPGLLPPGRDRRAPLRRRRHATRPRTSTCCATTSSTS